MSRTRAVIALAAALALGGCGAFQADGGGGAADDDGATPGNDDAGPAVFTSFYPLEYLTEEIGGDRVVVSTLTPPNVDPHTVELAPRTVSDLADATLVVYLSGFQAAVDEAVDLTGTRAFDAADHTELLTAEETGHVHADGDDGHDHGHPDDEHASGHGHDDAEGADDDATDGPDSGTGAEPLDAHFWLDPTRLADVGLALADELAEVDPDGADTYRANVEALAAELHALEEEIAAGLASCERDTIVVAHEAYGYLTADHGLRQEGLSGIDPDSEPSPARLAEIADVVAEHDVDTIFVESLLNPAVSEALARDLRLQTAVLDPLENQQDESADYADVMRANLAALQTALGCAA